MSIGDELLNRIVVEVAKMLAKEFIVNEHDVTVLIAEIVASDYKLTARGNGELLGMHKNARKMAEGIMTDKILKDVGGA